MRRPAMCWLEEKHVDAGTVGFRKNGSPKCGQRQSYDRPCLSFLEIEYRVVLVSVIGRFVGMG